MAVMRSMADVLRISGGTLRAIVGRVDLVDVVTQSRSSWFEGPFGFVLRNPEIIKPIPCRGRMGLFDVPASVLN